MGREGWNDDMIFDLIPDGILAVNRDLEIIRMNRSAAYLLNISEDTVYEGKKLVSVMEEDGFRRLLGGRQQFSDTIRLSEKNIWLERFFCCDREQTVLLCVMRDVTGQRLREERILLIAAAVLSHIVQVKNDGRADPRIFTGPGK